MKKILNILKYPLTILNIIISILLVIKFDHLDILPTKYFLIIVAILFVYNVVTAILLLVFKKNLTKIIGIILSIILIGISSIGILYINHTDNFLNNSFNNNTIETSTYNVIILKTSNYSNINELKDKSLGYLKDEKDNISKLDEIVSTVSTEYEDLYELYEHLLSKKIEAMLIDEAYLDVLLEDYPNLNDNITILYTFNLETIIEKTEEKDELVRPINIYISGSDSRSNNISNKSRSDVNMVVTVNPNTHEILLTSIPRDYYVQVHGQTGLKDKLTHAGIYGLEISAKTIEDLFDIEIDYSVKIGMNAVEEIVDLVGGVEIYSDISFDSYHLKGWRVNAGYNYMDGKKALAYARERYAYASGDRHRIQNQQQVLEAVLEKVLVNKALLLKYDEILNSLNNLYRTDIPREVITAFVKNQLDTMSSWSFETQWVDGKGASTQTHTAPNYKRYVMIPYEEDVEEASKKMKELINK